MLLQLFEMDRNSTWNSLCLGQQMDGSDSRSSLASLRRRSSSPLHCNAPMQSTAGAVYSHKHPELDTATCNDLNLSTDNKHPNCAFHQPQTLCGAKTKLNRLSTNICQSELAATMASGSQITRSEPATRSNSIECENDVPKLPVANKISHDVESSRLRLDLIVPNGK